MVSSSVGETILSVTLAQFVAAGLDVLSADVTRVTVSWLSPIDVVWFPTTVISRVHVLLLCSGKRSGYERIMRFAARLISIVCSPAAMNTSVDGELSRTRRTAAW